MQAQRDAQARQWRKTTIMTVTGTNQRNPSGMFTHTGGKGMISPISEGGIGFSERGKGNKSNISKVSPTDYGGMGGPGSNYGSKFQNPING